MDLSAMVMDWIISQGAFGSNDKRYDIGNVITVERIIWYLNK